MLFIVCELDWNLLDFWLTVGFWLGLVGLISVRWLI